MTATDLTAEMRAFLKPYTKKSDVRGALSLLGTLATYGAALVAGAWAWGAGMWFLAGVAVIVLAFASVRLYVLQHDCGHHSLFATRGVNDLAGYLLSVFSFTPYRVMQYNHNMHHAYLGNLDHRETTEIHTMTLREWTEADHWTRLRYRLYRNPALMLPAGAFLTYFIVYRWPRNTSDVGAAGVIVHNLMIAGLLLAIWAGLGLAGVAVWFAASMLGGMVGVFLVYLQHNFEETYWDRKPDLDFRKATLVGSSSLDLGWWWDLGTGNIAYHDLHHYNPAIPSYNLRRCQRALPAHLQSHAPIHWREALRSFTLKLWDEDQGRLVPFPRARATSAETMAAG
ncbi:MAG: fatty acid desaturase [Roseovarius sp.]|uniref:fatty acid desaturase n=1 Tax=Roseovarius sp. TaxID=1486281 RepID=UPI0040596E16